MPPIFYLLTLYIMVTTTASVKSLKIRGHILQVEPFCMTNGSTTVDYKMAENDVWLKQVAREFWATEGEK